MTDTDDFSVHGMFVHDSSAQGPLRFLKHGDPEIDRLKLTGWREVGLWDGETTNGWPCGGPVFAAPDGAGVK